ncbi:uncharacterized protein ZBAI_00491 [Zygosaccharomyces bailii ISA1307]|uniref:ZYBA0S09-02102g1_1 n=1 Tax=Zygosaccharomyces bailii (strain CLIB 213 / ATCC 58445 / CBS 680 / BCRC 21525 / NBRC 1098 / NCYC 1416 / NRRL Y-2227) TaxID=1333698 RepID=A0A8J2TAN8_ZYGB2|nr:ZYBA0S09-02102g1_1 [Zygosaccharomyces bailii CLIB 213]CDH08709.1 uncharacterized protein ZBAI_00491 [Zygosaccharomyces bailii ISA1307]
MNSLEEGSRDFEDLGLTPAMLTALFQKPHDRQFIVELENSVASFVESNAETYELRPMNSYYRLLSHQVAEYHNLKHALARTHDNCVIIFKGDGFRKKEGKPLLQELQPLCMIPGTSDTESGPKIGKRYRILKRRDDETVSSQPISNSWEMGEEQEDGINDANDTKATLEQQRCEREKKYEEKKQEIFHTPKKTGNEDDEDDGGALDNNSPQPYQFETSRYRFNQRDSSQQPQQVRPHNQHQQHQQQHQEYQDQHQQQFYGNGNGNGRRNRKRHSFYHDPKRNSTAGSFSLPYVMYPSPPVANSNGVQPNPQFPLMYPAPFPVDGAGGYLTPYMYQPMPGTISPGFGPMGQIGPYPFPYQYGQTPPMYRQFPAPYRNHGSRHQRNSRNSTSSSNSRGSFSKRSERPETQDEVPSSTSTMASAVTDVEDLTEDLQKLPI